MSVEEKASEAIPAEVHMISGCKDEQTSAVSGSFDWILVDPVKKDLLTLVSGASF